MRVEYRRSGLTLIESLVVIGIFAGVSMVAVFWLRTSAEAARRTQCYTNLKQIGLALENYESANNAYPIGYVGVTDEAGREVGNGWGWQAGILPYIEQSSVFNSINYYLPVADPASITVRTVTINSYLCPSEADLSPVVVRGAVEPGKPARPIVDDMSRSGYVGSAGEKLRQATADPGGIFFRNSSVKRDAVTDGMTTTLFAGERSRTLADAAWPGVVAGSQVCTNPARSPRDCAPADALVLGFASPAPLSAPDAKADAFAGAHSGGGFFLFGEASVRFVKETIDPKVFQSLTTRAGLESIKTEEF